ncbi:hypothetical protein [Mucilaginibacter dorajii]|uniref:hypothetical protein n=1 Tax=Mucilaginibacter dorajii TaxID=692994 RepID=UPI002167469A|nr:hypothetical protein [Mucilaginibacter dorajii]MCS3737167.1 hypothetical protein [Mucilaginibacter dorajii]
MTATVNNFHPLPLGYFTLMMLLALGTATYGVVKLRSVAIDNRSAIDQSDKLVIGFFNVVISLVAICTMIYIAA